MARLHSKLCVICAFCEIKYIFHFHLDSDSCLKVVAKNGSTPLFFHPLVKTFTKQLFQKRGEECYLVGCVIGQASSTMMQRFISVSGSSSLLLKLSINGALEIWKCVWIDLSASSKVSASVVIFEFK